MKKKIRTSVHISKENLEVADSIAESTERSRSWIIDKSIEAGLPSLDNVEAQAIRAKKVPAKKGKK